MSGKQLTLDEYQVLALRTQSEEGKKDPFLNALLGIMGELGEIAEIEKKYRYQGHPKLYNQLKEEAGDLLWYMAVLADSLYLTLGEIAQANIVKLETRYPDGFDPERSKNRED